MITSIKKWILAGPKMVFLSHTGHDDKGTTFTKILVKELTHQMVPHFFDCDTISEGDELDSSIHKYVENCPIFVCILTPAYTTRYYCMLELDIAIKKGHRIAIQSLGKFVVSFFFMGVK